MAMNVPGLGSSARALGNALQRPLQRALGRKQKVNMPRNRNNALTMAVRNSSRQMRPFGR